MPALSPVWSGVLAYSFDFSASSAPAEENAEHLQLLEPISSPKKIIINNHPRHDFTLLYQTKTK